MYHYSFFVAFDQGLDEVRKKLSSKTDLIGESLRGYNYTTQPIAPPDIIDVSVSSVADFGKKYPPGGILERVEGRFIHKVYLLLLQSALDFVNSREVPEITKIYDHLSSTRDKILDIEKIFEKDPLLKSGTLELSKNEFPLYKKDDNRSLWNKIVGLLNGKQYSLEFQSILQDMTNIWDYEALLLSSRILFQIANSHKLDDKNIYMNKIDLVNYTIPFLVDHEIDGSRIGLSGRTKIDILFNGSEKVIVEIKTGKEDYDRDFIQVAGYAMAYESKFSEKIDFGCIMYINLDKKIGLPLIRCKSFIIDNVLRNNFIIKRDKLIEERVGKK